MKTRRYKDRQLQKAYDIARVEGPKHPNTNTDGFSAYRAGLAGQPCRYIKTSISSIFWAAGADARHDQLKALTST